jgi:hypothetical protein
VLFFGGVEDVLAYEIYGGDGGGVGGGKCGRSGFLYRKPVSLLHEQPRPVAGSR